MSDMHKQSKNSDKILEIKQAINYLESKKDLKIIGIFISILGCAGILYFLIETFDSIYERIEELGIEEVGLIPPEFIFIISVIILWIPLFYIGLALAEYYNNVRNIKIHGLYKILSVFLGQTEGIEFTKRKYVNKFIIPVETNIHKHIPTINAVKSDTLGYVTHGGIITELGLSSCKIKNIDEISSNNVMKNVEVLSLTNNKFTDLKRIENFKKLKILYLDDNHLTSTMGLEKLKNLEELYLDKNEISEFPDLEKLHNLRLLSIKKTPFSNSLELDKLTNIKIVK